MLMFTNVRSSRINNKQLVQTKNIQYKHFLSNSMLRAWYKQVLISEYIRSHLPLQGCVCKSSSASGTMKPFSLFGGP